MSLHGTTVAMMRVTLHGVSVLVAMVTAERNGLRPTVYQLSLITGVADATIYKWLRDFERVGYVGRALTGHRYVTSAGVEFLMSPSCIPAQKREVVCQNGKVATGFFLDARTGKTGPFSTAPHGAEKGSHRPSARPDVGAVRVVLDGVGHYVSPEDALLLVTELAHSAAEAYRLEGEARRG